MENVQWKTPDDGQKNCPKYVEFYSKNKFEKLVHLVGIIIRINSKLTKNETCVATAQHVRCQYKAHRRHFTEMPAYFGVPFSLLHNFTATTELRMKERIRKLRTHWNQLLPVTNNCTFCSLSAPQWIMNWEGSGRRRSGLDEILRCAIAVVCLNYKVR